MPARFGARFDSLAREASLRIAEMFCEPASLDGQAVSVAVFGPEEEAFAGGITPYLAKVERIDVVAETGKDPVEGQTIKLKDGRRFLITAAPELDQLRNWWYCPVNETTG